MKTRRVAAALIATAAVLAIPAGASAKLLDDFYNEGIEPHADLGQSRSASQPKQLRLEFTASVREPIYGEFTITCKVKGATKLKRTLPVSGVPPIFATVPIKPGLDSCRVTAAETRYVDPFWSGWLRIRVWGSSR